MYALFCQKQSLFCKNRTDLPRSSVPKAYRTISTQKRLLHSALCSSLPVLILFLRRENAQNSSVMKGRFSLGMETVVVTAST